MRLVRLTGAICALSLAACGGGGDDGGMNDMDGGNGTGGGAGYVGVDSIEPVRGPLAGGNTVTITGTGFTRVNAAPNMLLVGGRLAESVSVLSDTEIEVVVPAGMEPGAVDVTLFNNNGTVTLDGAYTYNPLPTVTAIDPSSGDDEGGDTVTITGTGFSDFDAGDPTVWVDGTRAPSVTVDSDTQITITTPPGLSGKLVDVRVSNANGSAMLPESFLYEGDALLAFGHDRFLDGGALIQIDPDSGTVTELYPPEPSRPMIHAALRRADGSLLMIARGGLILERRGATVTTVGSVSGCSREIQGIVDHQGTIYAVCRSNPEGEDFGTFDPTTGDFTPIVVPGGDLCCQDNLVSDGTTLYHINDDDLATIDPSDGTRSNIVTHTLNRPRGAAMLDGVVYVLNRGVSGKGGGGDIYGLYTLDLATGDSSLVTVVPRDVHALVSVE